MRRRTLIAGLASTATIPVLAGCLSDDDTEDDDPDDSGGGNESTGDESGGGDGSGGDNESTGDDNESNESTESIETLSQTEVDDADENERNVESTASVSTDDETITISGQLEAPTPCHEAVIADESVEDETLTIRVELEETDGEACTQVISQIDYEATVELPESDPTTIVVVHEDRVDEQTAAETDL